MERITSDRQLLRRSILEKRDGIPAGERQEKSGAIARQVLAMLEEQETGCLFVYMHFRSEVQTMGLIDGLLAAGRVVAVPLTIRAKEDLLAVRITDPRSQMQPGYCGIPEPTAGQAKKYAMDPSLIVAAIVPGSVFDRQGGRLGYGGGYYDRFLAGKAPRAVRIGLAFEAQLVDRVPVQPHDQAMDYVASEKTIYHSRRKAYAQDSGLQG